MYENGLLVLFGRGWEVIRELHKEIGIFTPKDRSFICCGVFLDSWAMMVTCSVGGATHFCSSPKSRGLLCPSGKKHPVAYFLKLIGLTLKVKFCTCFYWMKCIYSRNRCPKLTNYTQMLKIVWTVIVWTEWVPRWSIPGRQQNREN